MSKSSNVVSDIVYLVDAAKLLMLQKLCCKDNLPVSVKVSTVHRVSDVPISVDIDQLFDDGMFFMPDDPRFMFNECPISRSLCLAMGKSRSRKGRDQWKFHEIFVSFLSHFKASDV